MSNKVNPNRDDKTAAEAARWVARLYSGNASQADEEGLERWLAADPSHQRAYADMLDTWDGAAASAEVPEHDSTPQKDKPTMVRRTLAGVGVAAALVLALLTGLPVQQNGQQQGDTLVSSYSTPVGETRDVILDDGTKVTLNTGSRLLVDFSGRMRRAILDSGEAFFDVERDTARPFVVTAGSQSVTVLGTKFNVQRKGQKLTVAVVEGVVAVHENISPEKLEENAHSLFSQKDTVEATTDFIHYRLEAGSVGTFEKTTELVTAVIPRDTTDYQSWRRGVVSFTDTRLADVVAELGRYTTKKLSIEGQAVADLKISGVFHYADLPGVYAGLETMLPVEVVEGATDVIIRSAEE